MVYKVASLSASMRVKEEYEVPGSSKVGQVSLLSLYKIVMSTELHQGSNGRFHIMKCAGKRLTVKGTRLGCLPPPRLVIRRPQASSIIISILDTTPTQAYTHNGGTLPTINIAALHIMLPPATSQPLRSCYESTIPIPDPRQEKNGPRTRCLDRTPSPGRPYLWSQRISGTCVSWLDAQ